MSQQYEKAKEILMRKAKELGVEADTLNMQAMDSLNRAPYIDALLLQNKGEQEVAKSCAVMGYGAIPQHYKSIIDDEKDNKLHMRVRTRLLKLKALQNKVSAPPSYSGIKEVQQPEGNYLPNREDFESAYRSLARPGQEVSIDAVLDKIASNAIKAGLTLKDQWRTITERNIKDYWSKK